MNTTPHLHSVHVELGARSYPVYIGVDRSADLGQLCRSHHVADRVVIITDQNVAAYYLRPLCGLLSKDGFRIHSIVIPPGERQKNLSRVSRVVAEMLNQRVPRSSVVIALGGGVIGDLAGFVAATYQRGVQLIHIPTSLLAQVDSSIGGKVGVNHPMGKNMIGAFYQPLFVWTDLEYLTTLPRREIVCGLGEIVKYAIIRDPALFDYLEKHLESIQSLERSHILHVLARCISIKTEIVSADEHEQSIRIVLNCGHTIGHALEHAGGFRVLKHGEAVLHGLVGESYIAKEMGILSDSDFRRISNLIARISFPRNLSRLRSSAVLNAMALDKKSRANKVRFLLPSGVGETRFVEEVDPLLVKRSIAVLLKKKDARV